MPARRKPTNVLEASGAFKKNPKRKKDRENEPQCVDELGGAPEYFSFEKNKIWNELKEKVPPGVLYSSDSITLEVLVHLIHDMRLSPEKFTAAMYSQVARYLGMFGMSPEARTRLKVEVSEKNYVKDEFFS